MTMISQQTKNDLLFASYRPMWYSMEDWNECLSLIMLTQHRGYIVAHYDGGILDEEDEPVMIDGKQVELEDCAYWFPLPQTFKDYADGIDVEDEEERNDIDKLEIIAAIWDDHALKVLGVDGAQNNS